VAGLLPPLGAYFDSHQRHLLVGYMSLKALSQLS
jgi:hypothetical protein